MEPVYHNDDEYQIFKNKKLDKVYVCKRFEGSDSFSKKDEIETSRPVRFASQVIDGSECHDFVTQKGETQLRVTPGNRQEIIAKFYEDNREIITLQIQKYSATGTPHKQAFCFQGEEINKLSNFIKAIARIPLNGEQKQSFDNDFLNSNLTNTQISRLFNEQPDLLKTVEEVLRNNVNQKDIIGLAYRKDQLKHFERLLNDETFFQREKENLAKGDEAIWQKFFEANSWILGYGLNYVINSPLEGKKLEAVVKGHDVFSAGKRIDLLMKTQGVINSLCFGEIKTHNSLLLQKVAKNYRGECWAISHELAGAISQIQKTVQKSIKNIVTKTQVKDQTGELTGEELCLYSPKSFLIIGSLSQFKSSIGINEDKYSSFELFRRSIHAPEIITFDELYERAKHIVGAI